MTHTIWLMQSVDIPYKTNVVRTIHEQLCLFVIICNYFYIYDTVINYAFERGITITIPRPLVDCREQKLKSEILEFLRICRTFSDFFRQIQFFVVFYTHPYIKFWKIPEILEDIPRIFSRIFMGFYGPIWVYDPQNSHRGVFWHPLQSYKNKVPTRKFCHVSE